MARNVPSRFRNDEGPGRIMLLTRAFAVERVTGIEPALSAWEADVLPLNYTRMLRPGEGEHAYLIPSRSAAV